MFAMKESKIFYFHFYFPKDFDKNLKHQSKFFIKSNEFLAEHKMKSKIRQLFSKYKHRNYINKQRKQQNEGIT